LLCEQLILEGYCLCVIDPEGDYVSLESLPGVQVFGGASPRPRPMELLRALRHADVSIVIDLSHASHAERVEYVRTLLPALATLRHHTGLPHRIVIDEAHYFLDDANATGLLDLELNGYTLVSYRASRLPASVLSATQAIVVTRQSDPAEVRALHALCTGCEERPSKDTDWARLLGEQAIGEAVVLPVTEEVHGQVRRIHLKPRLTPHVRHLAKYIDIPVSDSRAFMFSSHASVPQERARTLNEFVSIVERSSPARLDGHLRRGDFSRWIRDVFGDYPLAQAIERIEREHLLGVAKEMSGRLAQAVRGRYEFLNPVPQRALQSVPTPEVRASAETARTLS
jgi:hypothetical protein